MKNNTEPSPQLQEPVAGSEAPARLYDLTMVRSVSGGDEGFIKKMVQLFIETVPPGSTSCSRHCSSSNGKK